MFKKTVLVLILALYASTASLANDNELYQKLQDVSVTVKSGFGEGSGVIITREVNIGDNKREKIMRFPKT